MKNIDKKIKQLADQQSISPPTFVWENIENTLRPQKKKKRIFWLFLGIFMLSGSLIWIFNEKTISTSRDESFTINGSEKMKENSDFVPTNSINKESESNELSNTSKLLNASSIKKKEYNSTTSNTSIPSIKKSKNTILTKVQNPELTHDKSTNSNKSTFTDSDLNHLKGNDNQSIKSAQELEPVLKISTLFANFEYERKNVKLNKIIDCPTFDNGKKISTFLEIGGFLGKHDKLIDNGSNTELASLRRGSESSWYTYGIYGAAGINITPDFYFGAGVDYTQSKEKFYSAQDAITKMIITFDPNTGNPIDTSLVTGNLINQGEIKYTTLDIPVFAGYTRNYQSWDFGVELGGVINLNFVTDGKIYTETLNISHLNDETNVYKSKLGFGFKTSLLVRKNLKNGMSIQLKPTFKSYFNDINDDNYNLPMNYRVFGINLGLRKDF